MCAYFLQYCGHYICPPSGIVSHIFAAKLMFFLIPTKYLEYFFVKKAFFLTNSGFLYTFGTQKQPFCLCFLLLTYRRAEGILLARVH